MPLVKKRVSENPFSTAVIANGGISNTDNETLQITSAKTSADGAHAIDFNATNSMGATAWYNESFFRARNGGTTRMMITDHPGSRTKVAFNGIDSGQPRTDIFFNGSWLEMSSGQPAGRLDFCGDSIFFNVNSAYFQSDFTMNPRDDMGSGIMASAPLVCRGVSNSAYRYSKLRMCPTSTAGELRWEFMHRTTTTADEYAYMVVLNGTAAGAGTDGKVGINQYSPVYSLDVVGTARVDASILKPRSAAPTPTKGASYFDSDVDKFYDCTDGSTWRERAYV